MGASPTHGFWASLSFLVLRYTIPRMLLTIFPDGFVTCCDMRAHRILLDSSCCVLVFWNGKMFYFCSTFIVDPGFSED